MHRIAAALLALSVTQQEAAPPPAPAPVQALDRSAEPAPSAPAPRAAPDPSPAPASPRPAAPAPVPASPLPAPQPPPPAQDPLRLPAPPAAPPTPAPVAPSARRPEAQPPREPVRPGSEREQLLRTALAFVDALLRGDATRLAAESTPRFSFDGTAAEGSDLLARRWRELLAARGEVRGEALRDLVLLTAEEAQAQLGAPPARLAGLLRTGTWVAVADVSGRPLVLFLVRYGGRWAVAGVHD